MKFEIRYPTGSVHQVECAGPLVSVGRDPTCDMVLNDAKCSRRHAVIEAGPTGLAVRDAGSANGVFLNGKKVERAILQEGDLVRMGEVIIKVLATESPGTVVVGAEELAPLPPPGSSASLFTTEIDEPQDVPPRAGPPPKQGQPAPPSVARTPSGPVQVARPGPPSRPAPSAPLAPAAPAPSDLRGPLPRPLTVSVLAVLWALGTLAFAASGLAAAATLHWTSAGALAAALGGLVLAGVAAALAFGLWSKSPWARPLQIVLAGLGVLVCPFLPAAVTTLIYMLRPEVRAAFSGKADLRDLPAAEAEALRAGAAETVFSLSILGMVLLGLLLSGALAWLGLRGGRAPV